MATNELIKAYSEYLDSLNIHVLRNVARRVGVYKPTDGKKESLIERTVSVLIGAVPPVPQSKRGAPLKDDSLDPKYMRRLAEIREEQALKSEDIAYRNVTGVQSGEVVDQCFDSPMRMGVLEILSGGGGILRAEICRPNAEKDAFVSAENIRAFSLREGDYVVGTVSMRTENNVPVLEKVLSVNERTDYLTRGRFEDFAAAYPEEKIELSAGNDRLFLRCIDLFSPIGKGQRVLVSVPPVVDAAAFLREIASAVRFHADKGENLHLLTLLADSTPEEAAEFERFLSDDPLSEPVDFAYTTFDMDEQEHLRVAKLLFLRAARLAEMGENVVVLLDSLTRLIYAANAVAVAAEGGKELPCGLNTAAFRQPKNFFSMARNLRGGGSVTVIAVVSVSENDEKDAVIAGEFERFANCRISLVGGADAPIDLKKSGTLRAEDLLSPEEMACAQALRAEGEEGAVFRMLANTTDNASLIAQFQRRTK